MLLALIDQGSILLSDSVTDRTHSCMEWRPPGQQRNCLHKPLRYLPSLCDSSGSPSCWPPGLHSVLLASAHLPGPQPVPAQNWGLCLTRTHLGLPCSIIARILMGQFHGRWNQSIRGRNLKRCHFLPNLFLPHGSIWLHFYYEIKKKLETNEQTPYYWEPSAENPMEQLQGQSYLFCLIHKTADRQAGWEIIGS
jgi:hypothetical protein